MRRFATPAPPDADQARRAAASQPAARVHHHGGAHEKLREQGIEKVAEVKAAYLEGDGQISVIRNSAAAEVTGIRRDHFRERDLRVLHFVGGEGQLTAWPDATRRPRGRVDCRSAASMTTLLRAARKTDARPQGVEQLRRDPHGARAVFAHAAGVGRRRMRRENASAAMETDPVP